MEVSSVHMRGGYQAEQEANKDNALDKQESDKLQEADRQDDMRLNDRINDKIQDTEEAENAQQSESRASNAGTNVSSSTLVKGYSSGMML